MTLTNLCPCGSGLAYEQCCGRYHHGAAAPTAETLMRSRYSAYVLNLIDYLQTTWHPSTRPATLDFDKDAPHWCGLEILAHKGGSVTEEQGEVEFVAHWVTDDGKRGALHELSRFVHEHGQWYYLDGELIPTPTRKIGRNEPCPCGSGKKFKQCCGR